MSPTERSLKHLRDAGCLAQVVERWNPHARVRVDLWGFVDILALAPDGETIAVQTTALSGVSARVKKITDHENLPRIRKAGWTLLVHGWGKGANGKIRLREVDLS